MEKIQPTPASDQSPGAEEVRPINLVSGRLKTLKA